MNLSPPQLIAFVIKTSWEKSCPNNAQDPTTPNFIPLPPSFKYPGLDTGPGTP